MTSPADPFDFDAAVRVPFQMQPGLRRMAAGALHLTPMTPGSRHQREKLAVLSAFWQQALQQQVGFDASAAVQALCAHAQREQPQAWSWNGNRAQARLLGVSVNAAGEIEQLRAGTFGHGDEVARCLHGLPPRWRLAGLLSLAFVEDFALLEGQGGTVPWLAVCLPSHWAPEEKVGLPFAAVHESVADNQRVLRAAPALLSMLTEDPDATERERWERFVWNVTDQPRLNAHPAHSRGERWHLTDVEQAWWRTERQTFIPVPGLPKGKGQAIFTIHVNVQPLAQALTTPNRALALHAAISSMSPAVLAYRGLHGVRESMLRWLQGRAERP